MPTSWPGTRGRGIVWASDLQAEDATSEYIASIYNDYPDDYEGVRTLPDSTLKVPNTALTWTFI